MKVPALVVTLLLAAFPAPGQQQPQQETFSDVQPIAPHKLAPVKSKALLKAEADLKLMTADRDQLRLELEGMIAKRDYSDADLKLTTIERDELKAENERLQTRIEYEHLYLVLAAKAAKGGKLTDEELASFIAVGLRLTDPINDAWKKELSAAAGDIESGFDSLVDKYNSLLSNYKKLSLWVAMQPATTGAPAIPSPPAPMHCTSWTANGITDTTCN
jgi:hypothetical protein